LLAERKTSGKKHGSLQASHQQQIQQQQQQQAYPQAVAASAPGANKMQAMNANIRVKPDEGKSFQEVRRGSFYKRGVLI
jgi:hypothetical protein